jgi:xanthine dehydrogenase YagR molybdenum-binding subunit
MVDNTLAPAASGYAGIGTASPRIEARQKVTGDARYGSDFAGGQSPAYAYLATSAIALGRITQSPIKTSAIACSPARSR